MGEYIFKGETLKRYEEMKAYLENVKWDEALESLPPNPHLVCMCNDPVLFEGLEDEGYLRYSLGSSCDCLPCKCAACTISTPTKELLTMFIANLIYFRIMPS